MKQKILVVDDDPDAVEVLEFKLKESGYIPLSARDGTSAINVARKEIPALVILDLMLPGIDGLEVCRILRRDAHTTEIPIVMLTACTSEMDRVVGFEVGADDYVTKPFSTRELMLRVKKLLATPKKSEDLALLRFGDLEINIPRHEVKLRQRIVSLTVTEFKLLEVLARRRGNVQSRESLLADVWGHGSAIESRTVDTHMRRLREKIDPAGDFLKTVRGIGYHFSFDR